MTDRKRGRAAGGGGNRPLKQRVKTARGRTVSQTRWLERQLNDPYVADARRQGYRSRAAFKLSELDDRFQFLKPGAVVIDLGAAPGGWSQVAARRIDLASGQGRVLAIDINEQEPIPGVEQLTLDFLGQEALDVITEKLGPQLPDVVLSDMAAPATGHRKTDHLKIMALCEVAAEFASQVLRPGGTFLAKVLKGGTENELLVTLKRDFEHVRHVKPEASRQSSAEAYVLATGFRGRSG